MGYKRKADDKARHASAKQAKPTCCTTVASVSASFVWCACVSDHEECKLLRAPKSIFCTWCRDRNGGCTPGPLTEEVVIATRNKYMMEVLRPEEAKHCRQLSFDKETGAPLADCLLEIDRPAFLQGLRYRPSMATEEEGEAMLEQARALFECKAVRRKHWFDDRGTRSRKLWWFYDPKHLQALEAKYGPMVVRHRGKPQMETAWTENQLVPPEVGPPRCPDVLRSLFPDDAGCVVELGLSVNFQHEPFAAHCDDPCNGGYGEVIATLTLQHGGVVSLFSTLSGSTYHFRAEPLSGWGMRDEIMDSLYAHKVDSDYYPAPLQPNRKAPPTHHAACTCRKSVNWRALRSRDKVVTHPPVTDTA